MFYIVVKNASFCLYCLIDQYGNSIANSNICLSLRARIWLSETSTVTMSFLYLLPSVVLKHPQFLKLWAFWQVLELGAGEAL